MTLIQNEKMAFKSLARLLLIALLPIVIILISHLVMTTEVNNGGMSGSFGMDVSGYQLSMADIDKNGHNDLESTHDTWLLNIPDFETSLRPMGTFNLKNHILYPEDASSYIMPGNEVVVWYGNHTILTDGALLWKHNNSPVDFNYITDDELFNNPPRSDLWQNPDYYLTHGNTGDCEDFSVAFASILEAKGIPAKVLGARLVNGQYHWVVEYEFEGHIRYADINRNSVIIFEDSNPNVETEWVTISKESIFCLNS